MGQTLKATAATTATLCNNYTQEPRTISRAVIDIGNSELSAGCTFVAVSRLKKLQHDLFYPMTFERLQNISKSKRLNERKREDERLQQLHTVAIMNQPHM